MSREKEEGREGGRGGEEGKRVKEGGIGRETGHEGGRVSLTKTISICFSGGFDESQEKGLSVFDSLSDEKQQTCFLASIIGTRSFLCKNIFIQLVKNY